MTLTAPGPGTPAGPGRLAFLAIIAACGLTLGFTAPLTPPFAIALGSSASAAGLSVASLTMVVLIADMAILAVGETRAQSSPA